MQVDGVSLPSFLINAQFSDLADFEARLTKQPMNRESSNVFDPSSPVNRNERSPISDKFTMDFRLERLQLRWYEHVTRMS